MNKILGLDVGQKRIGVAISDGEITSSWGIVPGENLSEAVLQIGKIIREEQIQKIAIGIPKNEDTLQADKIHKFAIELTKNFSVEIDYVDETLTSKEAEQMLSTQNIDPKSKRYKEEVDKLSAKMILEQYLSK